MKLKNSLLLGMMMVSLNIYAAIYQFPSDPAEIMTKLDAYRVPGKKLGALLEIRADVEKINKALALAKSSKNEEAKDRLMRMITEREDIEEKGVRDGIFMMPKLLGQKMTEEDVLKLIKEAYQGLSSIDSGMVLTNRCPYRDNPADFLPWILSSATQVEN